MTRKTLLGACALCAALLLAPDFAAACGGNRCFSTPTPTNPNCKTCLPDPSNNDDCGMARECRCLPIACPILWGVTPPSEGEVAAAEVFSRGLEADRCMATDGGAVPTFFSAL